MLLANSLGDFIGRISFSLYLLHVPIIAWVNRLDLSLEYKLLLSLAASLTVAYLSYRYFEKPAAKIIRNLAVKQADKRDAAKASAPA